MRLVATFTTTTKILTVVEHSAMMFEVGRCRFDDLKLGDLVQRLDERIEAMNEHADCLYDQNAE